MFPLAYPDSLSNCQALRRGKSVYKSFGQHGREHRKAGKTHSIHPRGELGSTTARWAGSADTMCSPPPCSRPHEPPLTPKCQLTKTLNNYVPLLMPSRCEREALILGSGPTECAVDPLQENS